MSRGRAPFARADIVAEVGDKVELRQPVAPAEPRLGGRIGTPQRDRLRHREGGRVAGHPRAGFVTLEQIATPPRRTSLYTAAAYCFSRRSEERRGRTMCVS